MGLRSRLKSLLKGGGDKPAPARKAPSAPMPTKDSPPDDPGAELATLDAGCQEIKERVGAGEQIVMVDVRSERSVSVPNNVHIPLGELEARWKELEHVDEIVCFCDDGSVSIDAARLLREKGLFNATFLEGGLNEWIVIEGDTVEIGS